MEGMTSDQMPARPSITLDPSAGRIGGPGRRERYDPVIATGVMKAELDLDHDLRHRGRPGSTSDNEPSDHEEPLNVLALHFDTDLSP